MVSQLPRRATSSAPARSTRSFDPAIDLLARADEPDRDQERRSNLLGHDVGGSAPAARRGDDAETAEIRDCLERLGLLAAVA